jgi:hypothetical protein
MVMIVMIAMDFNLLIISHCCIGHCIKILLILYETFYVMCLGTKIIFEVRDFL